MSLTASIPRRFPRSSICTQCLRQIRLSSTTVAEPPPLPPLPPLLSKIKDDMKTAMRAKDKQRLAVIRGIISETNQLASSPTNAIKTDMQLLALLRKRKSASEQAAKEFAAADRADLREKQEREIEILDAYTGSVKMVGEEEMRRAVGDVVGRLKGEGKGVRQGDVMRELLQVDGGALMGKNVDRGKLSGIVKEALGGP